MIVITGMHRSGTSFTANLAMKVGLDLGPEEKLLVPDRWNRKGYYENVDILGLNNRLILGDFIRDDYWNVPNHERSRTQRLLLSLYKSLYLLFPGQRLFTRRAAAKKEEIATLSARYAGVAVKDPRFSLLLTYWQQYGQVEKVLYCYRHPFEVANSLLKRERIPLWLGYRIWLYHVRTFFEQIEESHPLIVFLSFNNFFSKERAGDEVKRIYRFAGRPCDDDTPRELIAGVLDRSLKNNEYGSEKLPALVEAWYERLNSCHRTYDHLLRFGQEK